MDPFVLNSFERDTYTAQPLNSHNKMSVHSTCGD